MRQKLQQNMDEAETLCGTRKVLILDEDIEDLARAAEPFEAHGFEVHKCCVFRVRQLRETAD